MKIISIDDLVTDFYYKNGKLEFKSKKRCPICNQRQWYEESNINTDNILKKINIEDVWVFDNLNIKNQIVIDNCENKKMLKDFLNEGGQINIFTGDFTESAGNDLESKMVESGIYNCLVHEKKNFSHGRFINYEHLSQNKNIYLKQKKYKFI